MRKTRSVLDEHKVAYDFINVKKTPVGEDFLRDVVYQLGIDKVVNSRGTTYRKLGLKQKDLNELELFKVLINEQSMIKRPLLENKGRFWIGFDEPAILAFVE